MMELRYNYKIRMIKNEFPQTGKKIFYTSKMYHKCEI
jgi:hypothetical protein